MDIDIPGGSVRIVDVELKGDASQSLRRGRRLVFFEFAITAKWEGELIDAQSGAVLGTGACVRGDAAEGATYVVRPVTAQHLGPARCCHACAHCLHHTVSCTPLLPTGDGELVVPDIDQDSGSAGYELRITAADDGGAMDARLAVRRGR